MKAITQSNIEVTVIDAASTEAGSQYLCKFSDGHTEWFNSYELTFFNSYELTFAY